MSNKEKIIELGQQGYKYKEIADMCGVTRQRVYQVLSNVYVTDYKRLNDTDCIYPNIRNWWNDNRMTFHRFFKLMKLEYHSKNIQRLRDYLKGVCNPRKEYIDKLIAATGMPYEKLFYREGD